MVICWRREKVRKLIFGEMKIERDVLAAEKRR
jgi:hypothetical protein